MGVFDRFTKKKEETAQDRWSQAIQAEPIGQRDQSGNPNVISRLQADKEKDARRKLQNAFTENRAFLARKDMDPDTVFRVFHGENVTVRVFPDVRFPTGSLISADPLAYLPQGEIAGHLQRSIPAGRFRAQMRKSS